jgi:glycosyltransferase involved in cell wall biosynthesis
MKLVAAISDVTVGYGTPQMPALMTSVARHFGVGACMIEPAQPELPPRHNRFPSFQFHRVFTTSHPHSSLGRAEYIWHAARLLNSIRPDVLVIGCTYALPVLFKLRRQPSLVIYYCLESIPFYGEFDVALNSELEDRVDVVIFPEENRAAMEVSRCGFHGIDKVVMLNATSAASALCPPEPRSRRNGRILYAGTINREQTFADYYTRPQVQNLPIDLYGPARFPNETARAAFLDSFHGRIRYCGILDAATLEPLRRYYVYSIVAWNPTNENQRFAAPNKLFESIAAGLPPIAAPHPQCEEILSRHRCGLLMPDWSFDGFQETLHRAMNLYETDTWDEMVANCAQAANIELNWDKQFEKLLPFLKPRISPAGV